MCISDRKKYIILDTQNSILFTGGPAKRSEMWMAITSAMGEFAGLGRNRPLKDIIVCWTYTMTDPARGMGYARLYSSIATLCRRQKLWRGK